MTSYDAGSAVAKYIIDTAQAKRALDDIEAQIKRVNASFQQAGKTTGGGLAPGLDESGRAAKRALSEFEKLERQYNAIRDSEIRAARAAGDHSGALSLVQRQIQQAQPNTVRYNNLLAQQSQIQKELAKDTRLSQQLASGFSNSLTGIIGPAALATAAVGALFGAIQGGIAAGGEALALREQQNSLRAVAGSAEVYANAINVARQQQLLFGGTLRENIDGIQGLTIVSRESGASLQQLVDISQRLNIKSPEQGIGGARIAITEALSGNITSLSRRFEIPKDALKALGDTSLSTEERLAAIDGYLNKIGLTSEAVAGRVDADAAAFRRLNAELETTQLRAGDQLASAFSGAATGLARLLGLVNSNPEAIAQIRAIVGGTGVVTQQGIDQATQEVSRREANSLTANKSERFLGIDTQRSQAESESIGRARDLLTDFIAAGGGAAETARGLAGQFQSGAIPSAAELVVQLERLKNTSEQLSSPFSAAASASTEVKNSFAEQALESLNAAREAAKQKAVMDSIAAQSKAVRSGLITQAQGADILRASLGDAADEALRLQIELDKSASIQKQKDAPVDSATRSLIAKGQATQPKDAADRLKQEQEFRRAQESYQRSLVSYTSTANQLAAKRAELAKIDSDDPRRFAVMTDIARLQNQLQNEKERQAKGHTTELNKQLGLEERIYDTQQKQYKAALDARLAVNADAKQDILDQDSLRRARNTAANAKDPRIRALAALEIERIGLEDQKRGFDINALGATAGGGVVDGRLLQSLAPNGGPLPSANAPSASGGGETPTGAAGASAGILVQVFLDSDEIAARQVIRMREGQRASSSAGGGQATA